MKLQLLAFVLVSLTSLTLSAHCRPRCNWAFCDYVCDDKPEVLPIDGEARGCEMSTSEVISIARQNAVDNARAVCLGKGFTDVKLVYEFEDSYYSFPDSCKGNIKEALTTGFFTCL